MILCYSVIRGSDELISSYGRFANELASSVTDRKVGFCVFQITSS